MDAANKVAKTVDALLLIYLENTSSRDFYFFVLIRYSLKVKQKKVFFF